MTVLGEQERKNRKLDFFNKGKRPAAAAAAGAAHRHIGSPLLQSRRRRRRHLILVPRQHQNRAIKAAATKTPSLHHGRDPLSWMSAWMNMYNSNNREQQEEPMMQENRIMELDILTVRVIKTHVLNILSDFGGSSCCMLDICLALRGSPEIKKTLLGESGGLSSFIPSSSSPSFVHNSLAAAAVPPSNDDYGFLGRGYFKSFFLSSSLPFSSAKKRRQEVARMQQMYRFMAALETLEVTPSSSSTHISTWEEAFEELKAVFCFSPRALQDLQRQEEQGADYFDNNNLFDDDTAARFDDDDAQNDADGAAAAGKTRSTYVDDLLDPMADFQKRHDDLQDKNSIIQLRESTKRWLQVIAAKAGRPIRIPQEGDDDDERAVDLDAADLALQQRLQREEQKTFAHRVPAAVHEAEARMQRQEAALEQELTEQARQAEARERAAALMRPFTDDEKSQVQTALYHDMGADDEIIATAGTDSVQRGSIQRLRPGQWLNDEVIHYFLIMLTNRDEEMCRNDPNRKRSHFFKSFFITKLLNEGHCDPAMDGKYQYANVKRWSKKVPGKDIFKLDKIIFPINIDRTHWVCAVAFMQEMRIQYYDSFGANGMEYLKSIMQYIKDEHKDKKKSPLPDEADWKLVPCQSDTPQQLNGYDCGVFTCMFADFVSKDCPLVFGQDHITLCRERIALSILKGTAIM